MRWIFFCQIGLEDWSEGIKGYLWWKIPWVEEEALVKELGYIGVAISGKALHSNVIK